MNFNQLNGIIRAVIPAVLAYAAGKGWITQDAIGDITAACVAVAAAVWSVVTNHKPE